MAKQKKTFADALNDQIANEFAAAMQYIGIAVHYDSETLPRLASFFYRQALEERSHAMMMVRYLLDVDEPAIHERERRPTHPRRAESNQPLARATR